ncbi:leucine-rich repeat protein kinase family protein [Actinidia rufa]|uniref:Leucine-rich repeat protein kinase family protein n=1 Tax=Actinidia rufa TaxID=165716 RepID=A0A7J0H1X0_9ERIC|nr:leucine-rich repeat protein kinase family protein [Actinidia rufa]
MALKVLQSFVSSVPTLWRLSMLLLLYQASHKTALASTRLGGNETDHLALLSIKAKITHDPMLITSSWNDSLHFCQWKGVLCGQRHLRVTGLNLESYNLAGFISPSIGNLSFLRIVNLKNNSFQGGIPHEMGRLFRLRFLDLSTNLMGGKIPGNLSHCNNLRILSLKQNKFIGNLPKELGSLSHLVELHIPFNNLTRAIPASFGNLSSLQYFSAEENMLEGNLPGSLANFSTQLQHLILGRNKISGSIPPDIGNLVSLNTLDLVYNQLTGSIPTSIGRLHKLQEVAFGGNNFSGEIPSSIGNLTLLNALGIEENNLQGNIPSTLGNCQGLLLLQLYGNNLSGSIPREVIGLSSLSQSLDLSRNSLSGPLPQEVGNLRNLGLLNLSYNKLSGEIPNSLKSCISLQYLYLDNNSLEGVIPQSLESLKGKLDLSFNDLEGEIPAGEVFQNVNAISVSGNNKLCGGIPALELPSCPDDKPRKKKMPLGLPLLIPTICGVLSIILISSILILCWLRKMRNQPSVASSSMDSWRIISYNKLLKATNGFSSSNLIGTGSFGSVYKGILNPSDQKAIAVKVFNQQRRGGTKSFMAECKALKNIRHRNLVKIITACASVDFQDNDFKALVYEYMENGSLEYWLHPVLSQTGKRPTDGMFIDGLDLHKLAKLALPERVMEIVDQNLLEEEEGASINSSNQMKIEKISHPPFHKTSSSMKYFHN